MINYAIQFESVSLNTAKKSPPEFSEFHEIERVFYVVFYVGILVMLSSFIHYWRTTPINIGGVFFSGLFFFVMLIIGGIGFYLYRKNDEARAAAMPMP